MTDSTPGTVTAGIPPSADMQDPLPEGSFFYRRVYSYVMSVVLLALLALIVWRIDGNTELREVAMYLCLLLFVLVTYYMIAPSAEHVVKMIQSARLFIAGVHTSATATAESAAGSASSTTATGMTLPAVPDAPAFPDPPFGEKP